MVAIKPVIVTIAVMLVTQSELVRSTNETESTIPTLPETWWGSGVSRVVDESIIPFRVTFTTELIDDLKYRLNNTRLSVSALENAGWTYGVDSAYIPTIIDYWLNKYNFKEREEYLNQYQQFTTNIQGLDIHFLHVKPKNDEGKRVLPLLIEHGWPGSVVEFYKIIPLLTTPREEYDFVFEVIAPSLPGFGFSSPVVRAGLGPAQISVILKNLMLRLGFEQFYVQGGDFGSVVLGNMAALFPEHVLGFHSNLCLVVTPLNVLRTILYSYYPSSSITDEDSSLMYPLSTYWLGLLEETGYLHIQSTKPDTVGVGLSDSPAALAAYILEKFSSGTNLNNKLYNDGNLLETYSFDELLDNLMVYWSSNSITTAMRLYAENYNKTYLALGIEGVPITVPTACAQFPNEMLYQPAVFLEERFKNLIRATKMPRGGHFAALEQPELLADDIWTSIEEMEILRQLEWPARSTLKGKRKGKQAYNTRGYHVHPQRPKGSYD